MTARLVLGEDRSAESKIGVAGESDRRVFILDAEEERDRTEELLAERGIIWLDVREDRGLHERARAVDSFTAERQLGAARDRRVYLFEKLEQGGLARKRSKRRRFVQRIARFEGGQPRAELGKEFVGDRFDDDEALGCATRLAAVVHSAPNGPLDRMVEIGVFENDERVASAQFHGRRLDVRARLGGNALARGDASGKGDALDARIVYDGVRLSV